ncbi:MAG TPA: cytidine deaminase [Chthoniobacterales bacterium]|nr:cytidine deaminase [Chthoniobacterales bacterium]
MTDLELSESDHNLLDRAEAARRNAYVPYSSFAVGAAIQTATGEVVEGCNTENVSFGLTMCAERVALGTAVTKGQRDIELLALVSDSSAPVVPCGACRQVLAEFNPRLKIVSRTLSGQTQVFRLDELLPRHRQGILG